MKTKKLKFAFLIVLSSILPSIAFSQISISNLEAKLIYDENGQLSPPITKDTTLFNTIIGEGESGGASNNTMIDITISNSTSNFVTGKVNLKVQDLETKKIILQKTSSVNLADKISHIPLIIPNTGCTPLLVTANVVGTKQIKSLKIPFLCGE